MVQVFNDSRGATAARSPWRGLALSAMLMAGFAGQAWAGLAASVTLQSGQPANVQPGEVTWLEVTLSNNNTSNPISSAAFSNSLPGTLPNGLKVAGSPTYTCTDPATGNTTPGVGTLTTTVGAQGISLSGGVIPARANGTDGSCTIRIPVTPGSADGSATAYTYTIGNGAVTGNDGSAVSNQGDVSQSVNVTAMARPTISKSFGTATAVLGGAAVPLTITVTNTNLVPIPGFTITDVFPLVGGNPAIQVANPSGVVGPTCNNSGGSAVSSPSAGDAGVTMTGNLPARVGGTNGECTITVNVVAATTNGQYSTGALTNTIDRSTQFTNSIGIRAEQNATANITVNSPLGVNKAFSPGNLAGGQSGSMTITLSNAGTSALTLDAGQPFVDNPIDGIGGVDASKGLIVTSVGNTCSGTASIVQHDGTDRGVQLTGGSIPAGGSCTITANFTANTQVGDTPVTYTNTIPAGAVHLSGAPGVVSQSRSATILVADTLRVQKTSSTVNPRPGEPVRYSITVENWTAASMTGVSITDVLPAGFTYLTGTVNGTDFTPSVTGAGCGALTENSSAGDANANFTIATVPARADVSTPGACVVSFYAMVPKAAANGESTVNTLPAGSVCEGGTCNGGSASSANSPVSTTVMSADKTFNPAGPLQEGAITRMTITLTNYSAKPITNLSVSDTLPVNAGSFQMKVASPANATTSCGAGAVTAVAGTTSVALNGGSIPAGTGSGTTPGTCVVQVDVTAPAGAYTNTATAQGTQTYADGTTQVLNPVNAVRAITFNSILSATKSFNPATVSSGGRSTVTVRVSNTGSAALTKVNITDPLPPGMVLATPTGAYSTCDGSPVITGAPSAGSITMTGARVAAGGSCELVFDVVATGSANWVNTIPAGNIVDVDTGVTNQSPVPATLNYNAGANITVGKAANPSTLTAPGQVSELTITVTAGATAVTGLTLTDYFTTDGQSGSPANGWVVAPSPSARTTCPAGTVTAVAGGTSVKLSGATLAASASCTIQLNVTTNRTGGITNYIPAGSIVTNQGLSNATQATTSLTTQTNLGVSKQFTPEVIKPGERSRLRLTFYNATAQLATDLSVTDNLPAGLTVPAGANPTTTCTGATVTAPTATSVSVSGGQLAAAVGTTPGTCYAEIDVTAAAQGVYANTIPAGGLTGKVGGTPTSNTEEAKATLRAKQPLTIHKAIGGSTLDTGNPVGFTTGQVIRKPGEAVPLVIRLGNPNADALTQAAFTDTLPSGLVVATPLTASTTCANGTVTAAVAGTTVALTGATIPAGGNCTVTVNVLSNITGIYTNQIPSKAVTTAEGVTNEDPTRARVEVLGPAGVGKQFEPPVIRPGEKSRLTIFIENPGSSPITLTANLTDTLPTLPAQMSVANPPNVATTCRNAADTAAANIVNGSNTALAAGHTAVRLPNGSTVPAGGCTIEVDVTAATQGSYNNNIPAGALQTTLGTSDQPANAPLLVSTKGYISGKVFLDTTLPLDGVYASGVDTPLAGVTIELRQGGACTGTLLFTTQTDAQGNYLFAELDAGTYSVCEPTQPTGTLNSHTTAGTIEGAGGGTPGTAANPTGTTSQITGIVLQMEGGDPDKVSGSPKNNFSEVLPSSISGVVFMDVNNDGVQQGVDNGLAGVTIELTGADWLGNPITPRTTTTDANGAYSFTGLPPGTYTVTEPTQPTGTSNGKTVPGAAVPGGTAGTGTPPATVPSVISNVVLPPGQDSVANNFAEISNGRSVFGWVYYDPNDNGAFDASELGIGGQIIRLTGSDVNGNPVSLQTTTAADGSFAFLDVPESDGAGYTLTQPSQPPGTTQGTTTQGTTGGTPTPKTTPVSTITGINLSGPNMVSAENLFGEIPNVWPLPPTGGTPSAIPTLSEWGLILMSLLLGALALRQMPVRRRW